VISNNVLQTRARKAQIWHEAHGASPMEEQITKHLTTAYTTYKQLKGQQD